MSPFPQDQPTTEGPAAWAGSEFILSAPILPILRAMPKEPSGFGQVGPGECAELARRKAGHSYPALTATH